MGGEGLAAVPGAETVAVVGAMTRVLQGAPLAGALEAIAAAGLREVGLLGRHEGRQAVPEDPGDPEVRAVGRMVEGFGLRAVLLWCGALTPERERGWLRRLEQAELLGLRWALGAGPGPNAPVPSEAFLRCLGRLADQAGRRGVRLALKPHGGAAGTGPALAETVRVLGAANVAVFYDPGNVRFYEGLDPCRDVVPVAPWVAGVCVKDHRGARGEACFPTPGDGEVGWVGCLQPLRAAGFAGPLLVECCAAGDGDGVTAELRACAGGSRNGGGWPVPPARGRGSWGRPAAGGLGLPGEGPVRGPCGRRLGPPRALEGGGSLPGGGPAQRPLAP